MKEQDLDFDNDADVRVLLLVHDTKPPFLDGRFLFTKQKGAIRCCQSMLLYSCDALATAAVLPAQSQYPPPCTWQHPLCAKLHCMPCAAAPSFH